jgi:hypothetical protein
MLLQKPLSDFALCYFITPKVISSVLISQTSDLADTLAPASCLPKKRCPFSPTATLSHSYFAKNVSTGNVDLRKAVRYGKSSQRQVLVLLLAATLGLLFLDW